MTRSAAASTRLAAALGSAGFLVWAVVCNAVVVGGVTELTWGRSAGAQIAIAVFALLCGIGLMFALPFALFWSLHLPTPAPAHRAPAAPAPRFVAPTEPQPEPPVVAPKVSLEPCLEQGRALAADDEPGLERWLAETRARLEQAAPSFASYFAHPVPGDTPTRLKRHLARLETIVAESG